MTKNCKHCGTPAKIIKVNRELTAHNDNLLSQLRLTKSERSAANNELRKTKRKLIKAKETTQDSVQKLKDNKAEMKIMQQRIMQLEEKAEFVERDSHKKSQTILRLAEKLKHIADVSSKPKEWLRRHG